MEANGGKTHFLPRHVPSSLNRGVSLSHSLPHAFLSFPPTCLVIRKLKIQSKLLDLLSVILNRVEGA